MRRTWAVIAAIGLVSGCAAADAAGPVGSPAAAPLHDHEGVAGAAADRSTQAEDLLAPVPADTPWIVASLEPTPRDVARRHERLWAPVRARLQEAIDAVPARDMEPQTLALLRELDGRLSREGLAELGLDPEGRFVAYGLGLAPVLRLSLSDPARARAMLERIDAADGRPWPRVVAGSVELARIEGGGTAIVWGVVGRELVGAMYPTALEREILPLVTGAEAPRRSLRDAHWVRTMRREHGLLPQGLGRVDVAELVDAWLGRGPSLSTATARAWGLDEPRAAQGCEAAVQDAAARAPEIVFGTTELSVNRLAGRWRWRMDAGLRADFAEIAGPIPAPRDDGVASVSVAFDVAVAARAARGWIAQAAAASPECPAAELAGRWEPPDVLADLLGGSATLHAPSRRGGEPSYTLALGFRDPERWLDTLLPPEALDRWPAGRAVALSDIAPSSDDDLRDAYVARTDRAVSLASGRRARAHARQAARGHRRDDDAFVHVFIALGRLRRAIGDQALDRELHDLDPARRALAEAVLDLVGDYEVRLGVDDVGLAADTMLELR